MRRKLQDAADATRSQNASASEIRHRQSVDHSLENWIGAMDLFADSMIPPEEEEIDLDHQPLPSGL